MAEPELEKPHVGKAPHPQSGPELCQHVALTPGPSLNGGLAGTGGSLGTGEAPTGQASPHAPLPASSGPPTM